ncbi:hypothetical protein CaCOL14_004384 [Colletotrichum acutatum]|uniref:Uncharacterized protein n=1 Tax=Glomerella acutata TaxID=27357 RepID=A0AAD8XIS9_GLOAC|nr:uncharacterized protein BDZ83DRAFT_729466 [Colletotrichum acutatum]KAK1726598.1 hypothetical protein BDZ83DRAFT_729466 [Colletotrichum acutatum]
MDSSSEDHSLDEHNSSSEYTGSEDQSSSENRSIDEHHSAEKDQPINDDHPIEEGCPAEETTSEPQVQRHSFFQRPADILFGPFRNAVSNHEIPLWDTLPQFPRPLPPLPPTDVESNPTTNVEVLLQELLAQESITDVEDLCKENPTLRKVFKDNMMQILRKHIAPEAWSDAICCVDRRLKHPGKTARSAFDEDYANGTVANWPPPPEGIVGSISGRARRTISYYLEAFASAGPQMSKSPCTQRGQWDLTGLCQLVKIIDQLLDRVSQAQKVYASFEEWENSWQDRRSDELPDDRWGPDIATLKPRFSALCRDDGTENPDNMIYAFERHTAYDEERGPVSEGVLMTKTNRAKLQRAFFRLEFIRRAYYQQPFYPRGAEWQTRNDTMVEGVVRGPAGETYEARLARAEEIFKRWDSKDEFVEVVCAFKATLNEYAIPVSDLLQAFSDTIEQYLKSDEVRRAEAACRKRHQETVWNGDAVGLQWEWNPYDLREPVLPAWEIPHSDDFFTLRAQLLDDRADLGRQMDECLPAPLARAEFDAWHATIYRSERIRFAPRNRRERQNPSLRKPAVEAQPMHAMSRFLTVMCSLPLSFMGEYLAMESYKKARFLKSAYWAVARVRASRCPSFLSGEMRAWCSNPNVVHDRDGNPVLGPHPRLLPEMSVRAASIACVSKTYEFVENDCVGWRLPSRPESRGGWWKWKWDDDRLPAKAWDDLHWQISSFTTKINKVFRMGDVEWAQVWRSSREFERQVWTGRRMDREVWEGYGDPDRVDGNDCYCRWGSGGCGICVPLPEVELPEWELMTPAEVLEESHVSQFVRQPWSKLRDLKPAVKEVLGRSVYRVEYEEAT